jgi:hypothetical protein
VADASSGFAVDDGYRGEHRARRRIDKDVTLSTGRQLTHTQVLDWLADRLPSRRA